MKQQKEKIDLVALALYQMAKMHYQKCDGFVEALYEHLKVKEEDKSNVDLWNHIIEQEEFATTIKSIQKDIKKLSQKESK